MLAVISSYMVELRTDFFRFGKSRKKLELLTVLSSKDFGQVRI